MKTRFNIFSGIALFLVTSGTYAQSLPDISYQDYGYNKPVKKVTKVYYSIDYHTDKRNVNNVETVEQITQIFNADGNIESYENQSFLDSSWAKSQSTYKKGHLRQAVWTHSNPYLNRTYSYIYDKQHRITEEKIRFKDRSKSYIQFGYKANKLSRIDADIDGTQSVTERYYTTEGNLYKETHRQKVPNQADIVTNYFYLEDKEIMSYVEPHNYCYITAYPSNGEIKFKLAEDSTIPNTLLKGTLRFNQEAPKGNLPFGLQEYAEQALQFYRQHRDKLMPYQILLYLRDENQNIIAEAEVDLKTHNIASIGFFKIEYADGTTTGTNEFRHKKMQVFEAMLELLKLP